MIRKWNNVYYSSDNETNHSVARWPVIFILYVFPLLPFNVVILMQNNQQLGCFLHFEPITTHSQLIMHALFPSHSSLVVLSRTGISGSFKVCPARRCLLSLVYIRNQQRQQTTTTGEDGLNCLLAIAVHQR